MWKNNVINEFDNAQQNHSTLINIFYRESIKS